MVKMTFKKKNIGNYAQLEEEKKYNGRTNYAFNTSLEGVLITLLLFYNSSSKKSKVVNEKISFLKL